MPKYTNTRFIPMWPSCSSTTPQMARLAFVPSPCQVSDQIFVFQIFCIFVIIYFTGVGDLPQTWHYFAAFLNEVRHQQLKFLLSFLSIAGSRNFYISFVFLYLYFVFLYFCCISSSRETFVFARSYLVLLSIAASHNFW